MSQDLLTPAEGKAMIQDRIHSKRWWILVSASPMSVAEFEVVIAMAGPGKVLGVCMAHKDRMSSKQLSEIIGTDPGETTDILLTVDLPVWAVQWMMKEFVGEEVERN